MGNLWYLKRKKNIVEKRMYFFGFLPQTNEKPWKSYFLCRIFFFIQIAYIILVKGGFV